MKKLNVRFPSSVVDELCSASEKFEMTASKVARDAMAIGLGVMTSSGAYVSPSDYLKSISELESEKK